jgi:hypothetical protein
MIRELSKVISMVIHHLEAFNFWKTTEKQTDIPKTVVSYLKFIKMNKP